MRAMQSRTGAGSGEGSTAGRQQFAALWRMSEQGLPAQVATTALATEWRPADRGAGDRAHRDSPAGQHLPGDLPVEAQRAESPTDPLARQACSLLVALRMYSELLVQLDLSEQERLAYAARLKELARQSWMLVDHIVLGIEEPLAGRGTAPGSDEGGLCEEEPSARWSTPVASDAWPGGWNAERVARQDAGWETEAEARSLRGAMLLARRPAEADGQAAMDRLWDLQVSPPADLGWPPRVAPRREESDPCRIPGAGGWVAC
ncbi:MAG: hypothetical protein KGK08_04030 [Acidobacteriota bacterium]|nr:hypothetical protein [Acidobacteriota bacterium]